MSRAIPVVLVALLVAVPVGAAALGATVATPATRTTDGGATDDADPAANDSSVTVGVGQQLSTVTAATGDEVDAGVETAAFAVELAADNESERAAAIADRARRLTERAESITEDYEAATEAYRAGELTRSEYARRIAALNSRAETLLAQYETLTDRAENVSDLELRSAGYDRTALSSAVEDLDAVTGTGADALLARFTGTTDGEVEVETDGGLSISVESEDGERSREIERPHDGDTNLTIDGDAALATARDALGDTNGTWRLDDADVDAEDGLYEFAFVLSGDGLEGEAEIVVDGSSGTVVGLEEEIERETDDDDETEEDDDRESDDGLVLVVAGGEPAPGETVTVRALSDGQPATNLTITVDGTAVGTTDANGTLAVTLPSDGATLQAERGDAEAELEFEFESESESDDERFLDALDVSATLSNGTVTMAVTYQGEPVDGATVLRDGDPVGETDAAGEVAFATDASEELELTVERGSLTIELSYVVSDGDLTLEEAEVGVDSDDDGDGGDGDSDDGDGDDGDSDDGDGDDGDDDDD